MTEAIYLALPFPPTSNHSNVIGKSRKTGKAVVYRKDTTKDFLREADAMFLMQKRNLAGKHIDGPFTYHLTLNEDLREASFDGENRLKQAVDFLQRVGLIANDKFAMGGSWAWGPCEHPAIIGVWPYDPTTKHKGSEHG